VAAACLRAAFRYEVDRAIGKVCGASGQCDDSQEAEDAMIGWQLVGEFMNVLRKAFSK